MSDPSTILFVAMAVVLVLPLDGKLKTIAIILLSLAVFFFKRPSLKFARAARRILNGKGDQAKNWSNLEKATKMGLPDQQLMTAASIFIQRGDYHKGGEILDSYLHKTPKKQMSEKAMKARESWIATARTMRSMVYWLDGDLDGAIKEMKGVHDKGSKNQNVFINYGTYLLEKGDLETAKQIIDEASETEIHSNGLKDNHGWYCILCGKWKEAEEVYLDLHEKKPSFPEAFVHFAQVRIHQGKIGEALSLLQKAQECKFTQTSGMKLETIKQLYDLLEKRETRLQMANSIEQNPRLVASGKLPAMAVGDWEASDANTIASFGDDTTEIEEETEEKVSEEEDRIPHTALDESDEAYLKSHGLT